MFQAKSADGYKNPFDGIRMKTTSWGDKTLMVEFLMDKGSELPSHAHPHEQIGYLVSGAMRLTIGEDTYDVAPGDSWCVPGGVEHGATMLEDSVAVEVFSPVRVEFLPENQ